MYEDAMRDKIRHAKVPLPKPSVHASHPFRNKDNHKLLLTYLQQRLWVGKQNRDAGLGRLVRIDKTVAGWL